ncbi:unnamed protein product [Linum trigynum]|uniref:Uncharacterized protein n=1 Tax=Linum trigynum TaxID=586398 RepID=A0AAV2GUR6_9ROSI
MGCKSATAGDSDRYEAAEVQSMVKLEELGSCCVYFQLPWSLKMPLMAHGICTDSNFATIGSAAVISSSASALPNY